jgi:carbon monoxide dehydrogenase subunit G
VIESATDEVVPRSPEEVFDFVADVDNQSRWNPELTNIERLTDGPTRLGSRMRGDVARLGAVETEVTVYERPSRLTLSSTGAQADLTLDFRFVPDGDATRMTVTGTMSLKGALKFMEPALRGQVSEQYAARGRAIKAALS